MKSSVGPSGRRGFLSRFFDPGPVLPKNGCISCNSCSYCMPCPYGVDIPGVFSLYNDAMTEDVSYGRRFLKRYTRAIPYLRQANHCIGCGMCVSQCPQLVDIPEEMRRIDELVESLKEMELAT